jgi:hypothetical protein
LAGAVACGACTRKRQTVTAPPPALALPEYQDNDNNEKDKA